MCRIIHQNYLSTGSGLFTPGGNVEFPAAVPAFTGSLKSNDFAPTNAGEVKSRLRIQGRTNGAEPHKFCDLVVLDFERDRHGDCTGPIVARLIYSHNPYLLSQASRSCRIGNIC